MEGGNSPKIAYIEKYVDVVFASETEIITVSFTKQKRLLNVHL